MVMKHFDPATQSFSTLAFGESVFLEGLSVPPLLAPDSSTYRFKKSLIASLFSADEIYPVVDDDGVVIGSKWKLDMLLNQHIKVVLDMPHLRDEIEWFLDDKLERRPNFWVVGFSADGFPRNKQCPKSTEACVQLFNMGGLSNSAKWTLLLFGLDAGENSPYTVRLLKEVSEEMDVIETNGLVIDGTRHTFKFLNKADLKFWHDFNLTGGCSATFFLPWYDASLLRLKVMDAVILPRGATAAAVAAAGGKDKVYTEYDFPWVVNEAQLVEEKRALFQSKGYADSTVQQKLRDYCKGRGHSLFNGVPYCKQALEGVPDPLHMDCNEMKFLVEQGNTFCAAVGKYDEEFCVEEAEYFVGPVQKKFWEGMKTVGLKQEMVRLQNRKTKNNCNPTQFRVTGTKTTVTLRNFYVLTDALDRSALEETDNEKLTRGCLHLSFLFLRIMSSLYSRFTIDVPALDKLGVLGKHFFALKCLTGVQFAANVHTMCYGVHHRLYKYFNLCQIKPGVSLGGGVLGSCQGLEGKHWFTRTSMACNTSMRAGCWYEELVNSGIRMVYGERHVPVPVNYGKYKYKPRIPVSNPTELHDECVVCRKKVLQEVERFQPLQGDEPAIAFTKLFLLNEVEVVPTSRWCRSCALASDIFYKVVKPRAYTGWCRDAVLAAGVGSGTVMRMAAAAYDGYGDYDADDYEGGALVEPPTHAMVPGTSDDENGTSIGVMTSSADEIVQACMAEVDDDDSPEDEYVHGDDDEDDDDGEERFSTPVVATKSSSSASDSTHFRDLLRNSGGGVVAHDDELYED